MPVQRRAVQVPGQTAQVQKQAVQVPKQGRNLRRESAFCMALMAQVPALKLNLHHLCPEPAPLMPGPAGQILLYKNN
jgi:hypothetical protein